LSFNRPWHVIDGLWSVDGRPLTEQDLVLQRRAD
jgi:hypothetical protein